MAPAAKRRRIEAIQDGKTESLVTTGKSAPKPDNEWLDYYIKLKEANIVAHSGDKGLRNSKILFFFRFILVLHDFTESPVPEHLKTYFENPEFYQAQWDRVLHSGDKLLMLQELSPLICPSPGHLEVFGSEFEHLSELVCSKWSQAAPILDSKYNLPRLDLTVGYQSCAFDNIDLQKIGDHSEKSSYIAGCVESHKSPFSATKAVHFPFLVYNSTLNNAFMSKLHNFHAIATSMRGMIELFQLVGRKNELNRRILGFTVTHDLWGEAIWVHYPTFSNSNVYYHAQPYLQNHNIFDGSDYVKTEASFCPRIHETVKNIYKVWAPRNLRRIKSALDSLNLPKIDESNLQTSDSGLCGDKPWRLDPLKSYVEKAEFNESSLEAQLRSSKARLRHLEKLREKASALQPSVTSELKSGEDGN